jgi:hypothetical protein
MPRSASETGDDAIFEWLAQVNAEDGTGFAGHSEHRTCGHSQSEVT